MGVHGNYGAIKSLDQLQKLADVLLQQGLPVGFDVETGYHGPDRKKGSLDMMWKEQFVTGFSISNNPSWARYVPLVHDVGPTLPEYEAWEIIRPVLEGLPVVAHHLKFEQKNLLTLGWKERGPVIEIPNGRDTMLGCFNLSEWQGSGLKDLVLWIFGHEMAKIESLFPGYTAKQMECLRFNTLDSSNPDVIAYACEDAAWTLALDAETSDRSQRERGQMWTIEHQISELMKEVELHGMAVAWEELEEEYKQAQPFRERMEKAVKESLSRLAMRDVSEINLASSQQLKKLLYRDLGYSTTRLTDAGKKAENADWEPWQKMSSDAVAMEGLSKDIPAVKKLLEMREVDVLLRRFKKWVTEYRFGVDGRIHASFSQVVVPAGRFAASDPAVQQLPKKWGWSVEESIKLFTPEWDEALAAGEAYTDFWTGNFRDYIVAPDGTYFLGYDYSQIELRVLAGVSQEPALLKAFAEGVDVHTLTASRMLGIPIEDITEEQRAVGKTQNFALMYQMGVQSLAERLAIPIERAQELYDAYFAQFSSVSTWMSRALEVGKANGFAETPFGRKVTVWELQHQAKSVRSKGDRILINAPIQGGAADYMKMAMIRAKKVLQAKGWWGPGKVMLIHNLHDALLFECSNEYHPAEVRAVLQDAVVFPVPGFPKIVADWELGMRHGSCKRWKDEEVEFTDGCWRVVKDSQKTAQPVLTVVPDLDMTVEEFDALMDAAEPVEVDVQLVRPRAVHEYEDSGDAGGLCTCGEPEDAGWHDPMNAEDPIEVVAEVKHMPTEEQAHSLLKLVMERPGPFTFILETPEGEIRLPVSTSLDVKDQGVISLALGGASVRRARGSVDIDLLAKGFTL